MGAPFGLGESLRRIQQPVELRNRVRECRVEAVRGAFAPERERTLRVHGIEGTEDVSLNIDVFPHDTIEHRQDLLVSPTLGEVLEKVLLGRMSLLGSG